MPRQAKSTEQALPEQTLIVDNGAYSIKAGFATPAADLDESCKVIPNCIARGRDKRIWIGAQLEKCKDFGEMAFRRPVEKGYLVNWEAEKEIWDNSFFDKDAKLKCNPHDTNLILTEAPNAPQALQTNCDQIIFEEFEFASYYRCLGASLNAYNNVEALYGSPDNVLSSATLPVECFLLIDSGFSHTTVTPVLRGLPIQSAIRRLDVGGKLLTNYLKELVSIRHYNMMDETHLMNRVKDTVSFVSSDFSGDLTKVWKGGIGDRRKVNETAPELVVDYVLPDYNKDVSGYMRPHDPNLSSKLRKLGASGNNNESVEDFMTLGNERFVVPEIIFSPGDIGMKQVGLPEMVMQSLSKIPTGLWGAMLANVVVVGGNALIRGFVERLETELRQLAPPECVLRVTLAKDPIKSTWLGASNLASDTDKLKDVLVTRQDYQEHGSGWLARLFANNPNK
ncbi:MAG: Actin- protein 6 [Pycnora praestabilis]|nr:MAG: Actin- protein 6 [Pycnora praestabilis]